MLPDIKTILYATDLGVNTRPAFRMAVGIANKYNSRVVLLHVIEPLGANAQAMVDDLLPDGTVEDMRKKWIDKLKEKIAKRIDAFCDDELPEGECLPHGKPEQRVVEGLTARAILETADAIDADMIVMGTHTHNLWGELLLGSAANKVMHNSRRPVLLVPLKD